MLKLKELEKSEQKLSNENAELVKSKDALSKKTTSELETLNKRIAEENTNILNSQADLQNTIEKTIDQMQEKPAPRRANLSKLLETASKLEKKKK